MNDRMGIIEEGREGREEKRWEGGRGKKGIT